jgi:eukaryotic-like serine/threonine-protein kinase
MRADLLRAAAGRPVYAEPVLPADMAAATQLVRPGTAGPRTGVQARVGDRRRRRTSGWAIAALTALAVLAVVALVAGLIVSQQPKMTTVPDLRNKTAAEAEAALATAQLKGEAKSQPGVDCPRGKVVAQETPSGRRVEVDSTVAYTVCVGPGQVNVPALVGVSRQIAEQQLTALTLKPKIEDVDSEAPKNTVVATEPPANTAVNQGTDVLLKISRGNLRVVPDVKSQEYKENEARAVLRNAGFTRIEKVLVKTTNPDEDGVVLNQSPDPNTPRDPKLVVQIFVGDYDAPPPTTTTQPTSPPG